MKNKLFCLIRKTILKYYTNINDEEMSVIIYGLESIYLTVNKLLLLLLASVILGITREFILLLLIYNIIRSTAFGLHASSSTLCLLSSFIIFIGGVYLCVGTTFYLYFKFIICLFCLVCIYKYAPADTHKRPITNYHKRIKFKIISLFSATVLSIATIVLSDYLISNFLLYGMFVAVLMILPATYNFFKMPYNNYKNYKSSLTDMEG